jgi:hypothetical protein
MLRGYSFLYSVIHTRNALKLSLRRSLTRTIIKMKAITSNYWRPTIEKYSKSRKSHNRCFLKINEVIEKMIWVLWNML